MINLVRAQPGIAAFDDGTLIAQHSDYSLVSATSPAQPGSRGLVSDQLPSTAERKIGQFERGRDTGWNHVQHHSVACIKVTEPAV